MARASHTSSTAIRHLERLLKVSAPVKHRPSTGTAVSHLFSTGSGGSGGDGGAGSAGAEGNCGEYRNITYHLLYLPPADLLHVGHYIHPTIISAVTYMAPSTVYAARVASSAHSTAARVPAWRHDSLRSASTRPPGRICCLELWRPRKQRALHATPTCRRLHTKTKWRANGTVSSGHEHVGMMQEHGSADSVE